MKVNYEEFLRRFEESGMTQSAFGRQEGMSSSMVSYYVRRAREIDSDEVGFAEVKVFPSNNNSIERMMKITYPSGIKIELPL